MADRERIRPRGARTGSMGAPRPSYYGRAKSSSPSPFVKKPPKNRFLSRLVDGIVLLAVLLGLVYSLIVQPEPNLILSSTAYHAADTYRDRTADKLNALKNRNKLTFDEQEIVSSLRATFPEISNASIELPLFSQKPTIRVIVAEPKLYLSSQNKTYVISSEGVAVGQAAEFAGIKNMTKITDDSGFQIKQGARVLNSNEIGFINELLAQCKRAGVPVASLTLPARAEELDLRTADKSYYVKFYLGGNSLIQSGQFLAARHQFASTHQEPSDYLDVRIEGKIFYK